MKILHTTKSNPEIRKDITPENASAILKNNTVLAVFLIVDQVEVIALNVDYYGDFVKYEQTKGKQFIGSAFISQNGARQKRVSTDKVTKLVDRKLSFELPGIDKEQIMKMTKDEVMKLLKV